MSRVLNREVPRPLGAADLARYMRQAAVLEVAALEKAAEEAGEDTEFEPTITAEEIRGMLAIKLACRVATRMEGQVRTNMKDMQHTWLEEQTGLDRRKINLTEIDDEIGDRYLVRMQAVDILVALEWEQCEGYEFGAEVPEWCEDLNPWIATKDVDDWTECEDWFFNACLGLAWEANPHWALGQGIVPFG